MTEFENLAIQQLTRIADALERLAGGQPDYNTDDRPAVQTTPEVPEETTATVTPEPIPEQPAPIEPVPDTRPIVSKADLQKKVVGLCAVGKKAEVRAIVMEYASKVSEIPEDKRNEVWDRLSDLEG